MDDAKTITIGVLEEAGKATARRALPSRKVMDIWLNQLGGIRRASFGFDLLQLIFLTNSFQATGEPDTSEC